MRIVVHKCLLCVLRSLCMQLRCFRYPSSKKWCCSFDRVHNLSKEVLHKWMFFKTSRKQSVVRHTFHDQKWLLTSDCPINSPFAEKLKNFSQKFVLYRMTLVNFCFLNIVNALLCIHWVWAWAWAFGCTGVHKRWSNYMKKAKWQRQRANEKDRQTDREEEIGRRTMPPEPNRNDNEKWFYTILMNLNVLCFSEPALCARYEITEKREAMNKR